MTLETLNLNTPNSFPPSNSAFMEATPTLLPTRMARVVVSALVASARGVIGVADLQDAPRLDGIRDSEPSFCHRLRRTTVITEGI